jgi:restriction system protein
VETQQHRVAYVPESRQLVIEMDLPTFDVMPDVAEYRYVKAKDEITSKARPASQRRMLYADIVAQVTLRSVHEMLRADPGGHVESIVFNGHVDTIDPRTGQPTHPCLITLRTTRDLFESLDLARVEPGACLHGLNASVSRNAAELAPVRPVLEFSMVDPRFVEKTDVLSSIDHRPNLMELTPGEFETLITNLFEKMGLETYGKASFEFAQNKPLELLSGSNLLYLLEEHAGIAAKIEAPENWAQPEEQSAGEARIEIHPPSESAQATGDPMSASDVA